MLESFAFLVHCMTIECVNYSIFGRPSLSCSAWKRACLLRYFSRNICIFTAYGMSGIKYITNHVKNTIKFWKDKNENVITTSKTKNIHHVKSETTYKCKVHFDASLFYLVEKTIYY